MRTSYLIITLVILVVLLGLFQALFDKIRPKTPDLEIYSGSIIPGSDFTPPATPPPGSDQFSTSSTAAAVLATEPAISTTSQPSQNFMHRITIETNKGNIIFETYDADAPNTVANFVKLANQGFYENVIFHRVIEGFMIQGGDPTGTGMGGPGYKFADELNPNTTSAKAGYVRGTVAMANSGPNTNGSQFFIVHEDSPLPHNYTIFGKVVQGLDIVDTIATTPTDAGDRPVEDIVIRKVSVLSI